MVSYALEHMEQLYIVDKPRTNTYNFHLCPRNSSFRYTVCSDATLTRDKKVFLSVLGLQC